MANKPLKWIAGGVGLLVGVAHIGVLGHLISMNEQTRVPLVPLPQTGANSSYSIRVTPEGYEITYIGDDPKVMTELTETDKSNGLFGIGGRNTSITTREFTRDGQRTGGRVDDEGKLNAQEIACIEAAGGGRSSGAIVGGSVAAAAAPSLIAIPYVGWLAAGWATLLGTSVGGNLGAGAATMIKGC